MAKSLSSTRLFTYTPAEMAADAVNLRILTELKEDPRLTMTALGRRVGLSSPAVTERVRRLEEAGVIRGYVLDISPPALGLPLPPLPLPCPPGTPGMCATTSSSSAPRRRISCKIGFSSSLRPS